MSPNRVNVLHTAGIAVTAALTAIGLSLQPEIAAAQKPFDPNVNYSLICKTSGMALDNAGRSGASAAGTTVTQWPWNASGTNQAWKITGAPDNVPFNPVYSNLECETSGMALAIWGSNTNGQSLLQYWAWWLCGGSPMPTENWLVQPVASTPGCYTLTSKANGMALDNRGSHTAGDYVAQNPLQNGNPNQQWQPVPMYSWVAITFQTGSDNLRGDQWFLSTLIADSWVNVMLTINGNTQTFTDVSQDQSWGNGSTHTVYLQLNTPVSYVESGDLLVTFAQNWYASSIGSDNWNLQGLAVALCSTDPDPTIANPYGANALAIRRNQGFLEANKTVYSFSGGSVWHRFTAPQGANGNGFVPGGWQSSVDFPFQYTGH